MAPAGIGASVEGVHAVAAAIDAGRVERLVVETSRAGSLTDLIEAATGRGAAVEFVEDVRALASTDAPQGVLAEGRPIPIISLGEAVGLTEPAALLVLDRLEDPRNVGAIARSALAAGVRALVVPTRRAAPLGATAFKAAAGALEQVRVAAVSSVAAAVGQLARLGVWTVGLAADGDRSLFGLPLLEEPVALVVGSEGRGLGRLVKARVSVRARIPLAGPVESLNASVAAALALYELARARRWVG